MTQIVLNVYSMRSLAYNLYNVVLRMLRSSHIFFNAYKFNLGTKNRQIKVSAYNSRPMDCHLLSPMW